MKKILYILILIILTPSLWGSTPPELEAEWSWSGPPIGSSTEPTPSPKTQQKNSLGHLVIAQCSEFIEKSDHRDYLYRIDQGQVNILESEGQIFIKASDKADSLVFKRSPESRIEDQYISELVIGSWVDFTQNTEGRIVPHKIDHGFAPRNENDPIYDSYTDDGNSIDATMEVATGRVIFVGRIWDRMNIKYNRRTKVLSLYITSGLWGMESDIIARYSMQCD